MTTKSREILSFTHSLHRFPQLFKADPLQDLKEEVLSGKLKVADCFERLPAGTDSFQFLSHRGPVMLK
jgi:hypothetical protein